MLFVKKVGALISIIAGLTACQLNSGENSRSVTGSDVGQIYVFSPVDEVVAVSFNDRFIAALQQDQQFNQKVCAGNYQLNVRSVAPRTTANNQVQRYLGSLPIQVTRDQAQYFELSRTGLGWEILPLSEEEWSMKAKGKPNPKLVRRLPDQMVRCN